MAAIIGALRAVLSLDSAAFEKGLTQAQKGLRDFDQRAKAIGAGLAAVGAAVSLVGAGISLAIRGQLDRADAMGETAEKLGIGVKALSELDYAAKITGVSAEGLETSIRVLSKTMAAAVSGNKGAADLFASVGVAVKDASGAVRPASDVMGDLADVFAKMPDGAEKTALAMKFFGKSGADMLLMLNGGSAQLRDMAAEAARFGVVLSDETVQAAGKFNETLDVLWARLDGVTTQLMAALVPAMQAIADAAIWVSEWFANLSSVTKNWVAGLVGIVAVSGPILVALGAVIGSLGIVVSAGVSVATVVVGAFGALSTAVGVAASAVTVLTGATGMFATALAATGIGAIVIAVGYLAYEFINLAIKVGGVGEAFRLVKDVAVEAFGRIATAFAIIPAAVAAGAEQMAASFLARVARMMASFVELTQVVAEGMNGLFGTSMIGLSHELPGAVAIAALDMQDSADALTAAVNGMASAVMAPMGSINALRGAVVAVGTDGAPAVAAVTDGMEGLGDAAEGGGGRAGKAMRDLKEEMQGENSLQSVVTGLGETFREVFKGVVTQSMNIGDALDKLKNKFADIALDEVFNHLFAGIFSGGGGTGAFGLPMPFASGAAFSGGRVMAFANGGVIDRTTAFGMRDGLGVMGEAGPEAIMPLTRGPGGKLGVQAIGGGGMDVRVVVESSEDLRVVARTEGRSGGAEAAAGYAAQAQQRQRRG